MRRIEEGRGDQRVRGMRVCGLGRCAAEQCSERLIGFDVIQSCKRRRCVGEDRMRRMGKLAGGGRQRFMTAVAPH